jgi:hypothetical protein
MRLPNPPPLRGVSFEVKHFICMHYVQPSEAAPPKG